MADAKTPVAELRPNPSKLSDYLVAGDEEQFLRLIAEVRASTDKSRWLVELCRLFEKRESALEGHWRSIEIFAIESELIGEQLRGFLENLLFVAEPLSTEGRITVYSLLQCSGSTQLFETVNEDAALRSENTAIWMDLLIGSAPQTRASLEAVRVELIRELKKGVLGLQYLTERLILLAKLGIGDLPAWTARVRKALPETATAQFEDLMNSAFGLHATLVDDPDEDLDVVTNFFKKEEKKPTRFERMRMEPARTNIDDSSLANA